eukprot:gene20530-27320_t
MIATRSTQLSAARPAAIFRKGAPSLSTRRVLFSPARSPVQLVPHAASDSAMPEPPAPVTPEPTPVFVTHAASDSAVPEPAAPVPPEPTPVVVEASDPTLEKLRKSAGFMKSLSFIAFWLQLALSTVSAGVLLFSLAVSPMTDVSKWLTVVGVVFGFISSFFAHGFLKLSRKLAGGESVDPTHMTANLLRNSGLNLWGMGATVVGLQASVGMLVAKSLMGAASGGVVYAQNAQNALVSVDVFALQASTNTLLCHVVGLVFANWMLSTVNKAMPKPAAT